MKNIWLDDHAHVSAYSASVKGTEAVVTVKIAVTGTYALGHLLQDLERSKQAGAEERRATAAAAKAAARKPAAATRPAIEHQPTRLLPYYGEAAVVAHWRSVAHAAGRPALARRTAL